MRRYLVSACLLLGAVTFKPMSPAVADSPILPPLPAVNGSLSLKQAVAVALANNPALKGSHADAQAAQAEVKVAGAMTRPGLSTTTYAATGDSADNLASAPGVAPQAIMGLPPRSFADQDFLLMIPLYTGGKLGEEVKSAREQASAAESETGAERLTIAEVAADAYAVALYDASLVGVAQTRLNAENEQVRNTEEYVKTGRMAPVDLLREQAEQADANEGLIEARDNAAQALVDLKTTLGISQESQVTLSDTLSALIGEAIPLPADLAAALHEAETRRPELIAAAESVMAAGARVKSAQAEYDPQIYAAAMGGGMASRGTESRAGYAVGLVASLPILDGGRRRADVNTAEARLTKAEDDAENDRAAVDQQAAKAWLELQTAIQEQPAAQAGVAAAEEAYRLADMRYNAGKSTDVDRLDALAAQTRAQGEAARAMADVLIARAELLRALGQWGDSVR